MKKLSINLFCLIFFVASQLLAQQFSPGSPEWLVDMFFSKSSFPEKANYFSGEMLDESDKPTIGEELNGKGEISFHQIKAGDDKIVFAVELKLNEKVVDFYAYLKKQNNDWKITAVRSFVLPDFVYKVADSLSNQTYLADSSLYLSLKLFTINDSQLKNYFIDKSDSFNELISYFNQNDKESGDKKLSELGCTAIFRDTGFPGCTFILINSFKKIGAGFIYVSESAKLPEISEKDFIYIEEILPGWYIFRTI
jgi:hypothetical protein